MKAVHTVAAYQMKVVQEPVPVPGPMEALVQIEAVGLCGSDYSYYKGEHPYASYPQVQGHEACGIIKILPDGYAGPIEIGDRVAIEPLLPCGVCYPCRKHRPNCCTNLKVLGAHTRGTLVEYASIPISSLYRANHLVAELAALVEPMSIGLHAVLRGAVKENDHVLVFGAGPIGQAVTLAASDRGARVFVVDQVPSRLMLADALGAERTMLSAEDVITAVTDWTGGDGPGIVFEATGVPSVIRSAVELVASSGTVVIIGLSKKEVSLPIIEFTRKELTILGSRNNAGIFEQAVDLVNRNSERVQQLVTHRFRLDDTETAIKFAIENPHEVEKVIIQVGGCCNVIVIVGAGAMGGWLAAHLVTREKEVVLFDVAETVVQNINRNGLVMDSKDGTQVLRVRATSHPEELGMADAIFFFVKAQHTRSAAETVRSAIGPSTTIVSLQNGWGNADVLADIFPGEQIVVGVTYHSATVVVPGTVGHTGKGPTYVGPYVEGEPLEKASAIGKTLTESGIESTVTSTVKTEIWKKLILNAATLPTAALTGLCAGDLGQPGDALDVVDAVATEAVAVACALGYDIELQERLDRIHAILRGAGKGKASMLQDVEAKRKTEIEVVNGAVLRAAEALSIDVPINRAMVGLIHGLERRWQA